MPGNNRYQISYLDIVVREDIPSLPKRAKELIQSAIEERLEVDLLDMESLYAIA